MTFRSVSRAAASLAVLALLGGCATVGEDRLAEKDPLEKVNRGIWAFDMAADRVIMKPVARVYRTVAPSPVRHGVSNLFSNLTEPWSFVNNMLQGKPKRAVRNLGRFVINTTVGIGGLMDHASKVGVRPASEDLGQTLAVWGFNGGPYVVLPLLGPSTLRDGIGSGVAAYADPINIAINQSDIDVWYKRGYRAAQIVSARSDLIESGGDAFLESSLDPYAAAKSAFLQRRRAEILDQDDDSGAGPADEPAGEAVPTPVGDAAATPPDGGPAQSAAPLPGDAPAADVAPPKTGSPQTKAPQPGAALPESGAPLPGDEPVTPPRPASVPQP